MSSDWQPIETAPKDGDEIIAFWGRQNVFQIVRWNQFNGCWQTKGEPIFGFETNATHWTPIPPKPNNRGD